LSDAIEEEKMADHLIDIGFLVIFRDDTPPFSFIRVKITSIRLVG
jgi:hypothetical protein